MTRPGFTLLESVVAMAIIGTVAIAALQTFTAESQVARRVRERAPALAVAREHLARLEVAEASMARALPDSLAQGTDSLDARRYEWRVTREPVLGEPDLYTCRVTVRWPDDSLSLATRVYRPNDVASEAP